MSEPGLAPLDHHLLGLLADGSCTGFEIIEKLESQPHTHEVASAGSVFIYRALAVLAKRRWIAASQQKNGDAELRTRYDLTDSGRNALWLATEQALRGAPLSSGFRRGLAYAHVLSSGILASRLRAACHEISLQLPKFGTSRRHENPFPRSSVVARHYETLEAARSWLSDLADQIELQELPDDAAGTTNTEIPPPPGE